MKKLLCFLISACTLLTAQAQLVYWDYNEKNLSPSSGSGTMEATYTGVGISSIGYLEGTTLNATPGTLAGHAIGFIDTADIVSAATLTIRTNTSTYSNVKMTFALATDHVFSLNESIHIYTSTGSGYTQRASLEEPTVLGQWTFYTINLPWLDNQADARVRIIATTSLDIGKYLKIDNLQIIPEPEVAILSLIGLTVIIYRFRSRRNRW